MKYEVRIDEEQRQMIEEALFRHMVHWSHDKDVAELWNMFRDLPREEAKAPDALHDFTL